MTITKELLKANAANLFATLDEINSLQWGQNEITEAPALRYINCDPEQGICLEYKSGHRRFGAYRWNDHLANIDMDFEEENPPKELIDKLIALLERLHTQPEIVKLLMESEYNNYRDTFVFEIVTATRPTEMYQDGYTTSYELRLNRSGRVSQTKPRTDRDSYLVAYNMD